jgi:hypothetical protein
MADGLARREIVTNIGSASVSGLATREMDTDVMARRETASNDANAFTSGRGGRDTDQFTRSVSHIRPARVLIGVLIGAILGLAFLFFLWSLAYDSTSALSVSQMALAEDKSSKSSRVSRVSRTPSSAADGAFVSGAASLRGQSERKWWDFESEVNNQLIHKRHRVWEWHTEAECTKLRIQVRPPEVEFGGFRSVSNLTPTEANVSAFLKERNVNLDVLNAGGHLQEIVWGLLINNSYFMEKPESTDVQFFPQLDCAERRTEVKYVEETVLICFSHGSKILLRQTGPRNEPSSTYPQNSEKARLPMVEIMKGESPQTAARRFWVQVLGMPDDSARFIEGRELLQNLDRYPGLAFAQRVRLMTVRLCTKDASILPKVSLPDQQPFHTVDADGKLFEWTWQTPEQCENELGVDIMQHDRAGLDFLHMRSTAGVDADSSARTGHVLSILQKYGVSTSTWTGAGGTRTVDDLLRELEEGLSEFQDDGNSVLLRVVRVVVIRLWAPPGRSHMLLQVGASSRPNVEFKFEPKLLGGRLYGRESAIEAATRILQEFLQINEEDADFPSEHSLEYQEELGETNEAFPGLVSKYMKFYIDCSLSTCDAARFGLERLASQK